MVCGWYSSPRKPAFQVFAQMFRGQRLPPPPASPPAVAASQRGGWSRASGAAHRQIGDLRRDACGGLGPRRDDRGFLVRLDFSTTSNPGPFPMGCPIARASRLRCPRMDRASRTPRSGSTKNDWKASKSSGAISRSGSRPKTPAGRAKEKGSRTRCTGPGNRPATLD